MNELLFKNVTLRGIDGLFNISVDKGRIISVSKEASAEAKEVIDCDGSMAIPGFVDSHMHFDKVLSLGETESKTLQAAVKNFTAYCKSIPEGRLKDDVKRRAKEVARMVVKNGTLTLRTNANVEAVTGLTGIEALNELREEVSDYVDIKITALPSFYDGPEYQAKRMELLEYACKNKLIDFLGGAPHLHDNCSELTEKFFEIANKYGVPLDLHVDESDHPDVSNFEQIADLTMKYGLEGRVSCGHVTALNAVDDATAARAIEKAKKANLHIVTLPSCNLYLMGRIDKQPIRRGVTRIREFLEAGVNISYASDNIRDPFRPIGNGDMLEEGLLTAQVAQMVTKSDLEVVFDMGTVNPAKALLLSDYGIKEGNPANFVIIAAKSGAEALVNQSPRTYVVKNGRIVAKTSVSSQIMF